MSSEFTGRQFAAGSVTAIRAFSVDSLGRLCSPQQSFVFKPGVNEAECSNVGRALHSFARSYATFQWSASALTPVAYSENGAQMVTGPQATSKPTVELEKEPEHRPGQLGCSCGFYAYYTADKNPYHGDRTVEAVVEATGVVTHGTKGIRAERVEVVGIIDPFRGTVRDKWDAFSAAVADKMSAFCIFPGIAGIAGGVSAVVAAFAESPWWWFAVPFFLALIGVFAAGAHGEFGDCGVYDLIDSPRLRSRIGLVRRNYPDVPVYKSRKAALKAHPLTQPPTPAAPSPDDEDFWTRSAS